MGHRKMFSTRRHEENVPPHFTWVLGVQMFSISIELETLRGTAVSPLEAPYVHIHCLHIMIMYRCAYMYFYVYIMCALRQCSVHLRRSEILAFNLDDSSRGVVLVPAIIQEAKQSGRGTHLVEYSGGRRTDGHVAEQQNNYCNNGEVLASHQGRSRIFGN